MSKSFAAVVATIAVITTLSMACFADSTMSGHHMMVHHMMRHHMMVHHWKGHHKMMGHHPMMSRGGMTHKTM
jgi:hypothetical protein